MSGAINWPAEDAYLPIAKGRAKAPPKPPPAVSLSVTDGAGESLSGGGKATLSIAPELIDELGWAIGEGLVLGAHEGEHAVFLRLTPDRGGAFALRPSPKPRANGAPGRGFVHLGRCGGLELPACKAVEVGCRAIRLPDAEAVKKGAPPPRPRFALEVVVDRAAGPSDLDSWRRPGAKDKPEPARKPGRPPKAVARALPPTARDEVEVSKSQIAREKAAVFLARQLRDAGEASRFIIREIENVHGLKVDDAWLERALGRAPEDAAEADA